MKYKTIALELLQQRTELHEHLRQTRSLRTTMEALAMELRDRHLDWMKTLQAAKPGSHQYQISSEAMELAVKETEDRLSSESPLLDHPEMDSLDQAMAFVRNHSSRG